MTTQPSVDTPNTEDRPPLYGLVLAGGRSSRMGEDKGGLSYYGEIQTDRMMKLLARFCPHYFVSIRSDQHLGFPFVDHPQLHDLFSDIGPMGGILSAMMTLPKAAWLVVACDMPNVDASVIQTLVSHRNPACQATAFRHPHGDFAEPLCAIYEPSSQPVLMAAKEAGRLSLRDGLKEIAVEILEVPTGQDTLVSINTPDEYAQYKESHRA